MTLANWGSLNFTSARERQSKSLIDGNSESGTTIEHGAKALWWRLDNGGELRATWSWWGWRTSHYVVQARAQASECAGATWLSSSILSPHSGHHNRNYTQHKPSKSHCIHKLLTDQKSQTLICVLIGIKRWEVYELLYRGKRSSDSKT